MIKFFRKIRQKLLSDNKFNKYFLYAIGEIVLVVIGILIALQINNWNDLSKRKKQRQAYTQSLITNLKQDSIALDGFLKSTEQDFNSLMKHIRKINSPTMTADSLVKIARYEFKQTTNVFANSFNNQTFQTLVTSGDIELFDKKLSNELMALNSLQEDFNLSIATHNNNYIRQLSKYAELYPLLFQIPKVESPVQKLMWNSINKKEFSSLFSSVATLKTILETSGRSYNRRLFEKTSELLEKLRAQSNTND